MTPGLFRNWRGYWRFVGELFVLAVGAAIIITVSLWAGWQLGHLVDMIARRLT